MAENNWKGYDFADSVRQVCAQFRADLNAFREMFNDSQEKRRKQGLVAVAFLGPGRAGKDTCAELLSKCTPLRYAGSISKLMNPLLARALALPEQDSWERRHEFHEFWRPWMDEFREQEGQDTPTRMQLSISDVTAGIWSWREVWSAYRNGVVDHVVWVHREGYDHDRLAQGYGSKDVLQMHGYILRNEGLEGLPLQMRQLAMQLELPLTT